MITGIIGKAVNQVILMIERTREKKREKERERKIRHIMPRIKSSIGIDESRKARGMDRSPICGSRFKN